MIDKHVILSLTLLCICISLIPVPALATSANISFNITGYSPGDYYYYNVSANSTLFSNPLNGAQYIHIDNGQWRVNPMGAANGDAFATYLYNLIAVICINVFAYVAGRARIRFNLIWVGGFGLFFWGIGWLQTTYLLVSVAIAYAVITYLRFAEEESSS